MDEHLVDLLSALVPLRAAELKHLDAEALRRHVNTLTCGLTAPARDGRPAAPCCSDAATVIATHADALLFRTESRSQERARSAVRRALVDGVAVAMLTTPGGLSVGGRHWCRDHTECEAAERYAMTRPSPGGA